MSNNRYSQLICLALGVGIFLAFVIPNHKPPWQNFFNEYLGGLAFAPIAGAAGLLGARLPTTGWIFLLLTGIVWAQHYFGLVFFAGEAWLASLYLLGGAGIMAAARCSVTNSVTPIGQADRSLWAGITLAGLVSVGIAVHQWLGMDQVGLFFMEIPPGGRPYANLGQPNHLATLLLLSILGIWLIWEQRLIGALTAVSSVVLLVFGLVLTFSRTPVVAMLWLLPLLAFAKYRGWIRLPIIFAVGLVALFFALVASIGDISRLLYLALPAGGGVERLSLKDLRLEIWLDALKAIWKSPWVGYGWYQTPLAQLNVADGTQVLGQLLPSTHNLVLDLTVWLGIPLATALMIVLAWIFFANFNARIGVVGIAAWLGVAVILNHAMLEYAELYAYFFAPACWWLGVLSAGSGSQLQTYKGESPKFLWISSRPLVLISAVLLIVVGWEYLNYQSDWEVKRFRDALMDKSIQVPVRDPVLLTQLDAQLELSAYDPFAVPREKPPVFAVEAAQRYPYPSNLLKLAIIQAMNGQESAASETMNKLCMLYRQAACESARATWVAVGKSQIPELARVALRPLP
jgi:O-antigen ligase